MRAALFPGQGTQWTGMGERFCHLSRAARDVFDRATELLGWDVKALCFRGDPSTLRATRNAQVAVVVTSLAALELAYESGFVPDIVAGHSVGDLTAMAAAQAMTIDDVIRTVDFRAALMGALPENGAMIAVQGLAESVLGELCDAAAQRGAVAVALVNSAQDVVVSGAIPAVDEVRRRAEALGGRVREPRVSHAFHSPLMQGVVAPWRRYLNEVDIRKPAIPLVGNVSGAVVHEAEDLRQELVQQVVHPVRWRQTLGTIVALGGVLAVEIGDSKTLTALSRRNIPRLRTIPLGTQSGLRDIASALAH